MKERNRKKHRRNKKESQIYVGAQIGQPILTVMMIGALATASHFQKYSLEVRWL